MRITLIIGLPASGKTTYAKTLGGFLVDDPQSINELPLECDHLVITDPNFCIQQNLDRSIIILKKKYLYHLFQKSIWMSYVQENK